MNKKKIVIIASVAIAILLIIIVPKIAKEIQHSIVTSKMEKLRKEADDLTAQGEYLQATEVLKEMIALQKGEDYIRDEDPEETFEISGEAETGTLMNYLSFSDIDAIWSNYSDTGEIVGKITNKYDKTIEGYFAMYFYDDSGDIVYPRDSIPIPGEGIKPGETVPFSVLVNKFEYSTYEIRGDILREK